MRAEQSLSSLCARYHADQRHTDLSYTRLLNHTTQHRPPENVSVHHTVQHVPAVRFCTPHHSTQVCTRFLNIAQLNTDMYKRLYTPHHSTEICTRSHYTTKHRPPVHISVHTSLNTTSCTLHNSTQTSCCTPHNSSQICTRFCTHHSTHTSCTRLCTSPHSTQIFTGFCTPYHSTQTCTCTKHHST